MDTCIVLTNTVHNDVTGLESGLDPKIIWVSKKWVKFRNTEKK